MTGTPRWRQFADAVLCRADPRVDRRIRELLNDDGQWRLVARLTPYDRRHLLTVHDRLVAAGYTDPDLLRAALLHDIGKADERARVGTPHRVLRVVLRRVWPGLLRWLATERKLSHRLYLAEHHAALGARAARQAGASERCCALIAAHEATSDATADRLLLALIAADSGAPLP
jgi:putative nucleotidyltransferase with HDIG domain